MYLVLLGGLRQHDLLHISNSVARVSNAERRRRQSGSRAVITSRCELYARWWEAQVLIREPQSSKCQSNLYKITHENPLRDNQFISTDSSYWSSN